MKRYYEITANGAQSATIATTAREALRSAGVELADNERAKAEVIYVTADNVEVYYRTITREEYERINAAQTEAEQVAGPTEPEMMTYFEANPVPPQPSAFYFSSAQAASIPPPSRRNRSRTLFGVTASA